jgi:AbrB family looped-hinge helix DNA binding protein
MKTIFQVSGLWAIYSVRDWVVTARLVIPSACRKQLGLKAGDDVVFEIKGEALHLMRPSKATYRDVTLDNLHPSLFKQGRK